MKLSAPFLISARLLPAVRVGNATISLSHIKRENSGRDCYSYHIDTPEFEHEGDDLRTGCQGGGYQDAMKSLLSFLSAAAESYRYHMFHRKSEDDDPDSFPPEVMEWCYQNSDELQMLALELEEAGELIEY